MKTVNGELGFPKGDLEGSLWQALSEDSFQIRACIVLSGTKRIEKRWGFTTQLFAFVAVTQIFFLESPICLFFFVFA